MGATAGGPVCHYSVKMRGKGVIERRMKRQEQKSFGDENTARRRWKEFWVNSP